MFKRPPYEKLAEYADDKAMPRWLVYVGAWGILNIGDQSRVMFLSLLVLAAASVVGFFGLLLGINILSALSFFGVRLIAGRDENHRPAVCLKGCILD